MKEDTVPGLGIFSWFSYQFPLAQRLEMARKLGLEIDYVHAPFDNPNDLWRDGLNGEDYVDMLLSSIHDGKRITSKQL